MSDFQNGYPPLKPNNGKLFKNTDKIAGDMSEQNQARPDYSGPFTNERGDEARVAMWLNTAKNGNKYMNITVSEKFEAKQQIQTHQQAPTPPPMPDDFFEDDDVKAQVLGDTGRF
jgi:hypothetical protein